MGNQDIPKESQVGKNINVRTVAWDWKQTSKGELGPQGSQEGNKVRWASYLKLKVEKLCFKPQQATDKFQKEGNAHKAVCLEDWTGNCGLDRLEREGTGGRKSIFQHNVLITVYKL